MPSLLEYFLYDILGEIPHLSAKKMFGGYGLYVEKTIFGIYADNGIFLKVSPEIIEEMKKKKSHPFSYARNGKVISMKHYFLVPEAIIDNSALLKKWGIRAIEFSKK